MNAIRLPTYKNNPVFGFGNIFARSCLVAVLLFSSAFLASAETAPKAKIDSFRVIGTDRDRIKIEIKYSHDDISGQVRFGAKASSRDGSISSNGYFRVDAPAGQHIASTILLIRPSQAASVKTDSLEIFLFKNDEKPFFSETFDWPYQWPELAMAESFQGASKEWHRKRILNDAITIIDDSDQLGRKELDVAKGYLDSIIRDDPNNAQAYLELARIAMKADYAGTEHGRYPGLDEAQRLIKVALKIDPGYANSYILYGYVLAVQKTHTNEAIAAFKKAEQLGTSNMWLYYNWGLALENADRNEEAIKKYQEGVALTPMPDKPELRSNNRAIPLIYSRLMNLHEKRNDLPAIDALYQKRLAVLNESCQKTYYGQFKLYRMGDYETAIIKGTQAQEQNCRAGARPLLAAAYLAKWALDRTLAPAEREKILNRAQAFITSSQQTIVDLASSEFTAKVLPKLRDADLQIDGPDAKEMTPLAYAVADGNSYAIRALIRAGANPDHALKDGWTPLMLGVVSRQSEAVSILLNAKANPERKTRDGQTAMSLARSLGDAKMIRVLSEKTSF